MKDYEGLLAEYKDPYLNQDYMTLDAVRSFEVSGRGKIQVRMSLTLPYPCALIEERIQRELGAHFATQNLKLELQLVQDIPRVNPRPQTKGLGEVRNIIAVASGKGGVGKSTVSLNIARALAAHGASIGILDADIYGPSQTQLLKTQAKKDGIVSGKELIPVMAEGLQTMSLGYLLADGKTPTIWRGAMASNALRQLLYSSKWQQVDYLIIDLPPGSGDIQLTLCQQASISGAVIISTPHELALTGAAKGVEMFRRLYVPVVGMVENMSYYLCPQCAEKHYVFGKKESARLAKKMSVPFLAEIPIRSDCALPLKKQPHEMREKWQQLALDIALSLTSMQAALPPEIVIKED